MRFRTYALSFVVVAAFFAVAVPSPAESESCTQGYFASLFCDRSELAPDTEWNAEEAIARLKELGIEPTDGWESDKALDEGTMVMLLRFVDIPVFTSHPERIVTVLEARAIFDRFRKKLIETMPAMLVVDGQTATTIDGESHIAPPLSP